MNHKTTAILGATIGFILGASGVCLWYFSRPAITPVVIRVLEV